MTTENVQELKPVEQGNFSIVIDFLNDTHVEFTDILGYQVGSYWAAISMKDGSTYAYPTVTIRGLKHYPTPKE